MSGEKEYENSMKIANGKNVISERREENNQQGIESKLTGNAKSWTISFVKINK